MEGKKDPNKHNYMKRIATLQRAGKIPSAPGVYQIDVRHDDWCNIYRGGYCNCDPEIVLRKDGKEALL